MAVLSNTMMHGTSAISDTDAYLVKKSLKFDHVTTDKLRRDGQSGNRRTNTLSYWLKNTGDDTVNVITGGGWDGGNRWHSGIGSDGKFYRYERIGSSDKIEFIGTRTLRDPSAWMHIVEVIDTNHSWDIERFRLFINGEQETLSYTTKYSQHLETLRDAGRGFNIGGRFDMSGDHFAGLISDVHYIDGLALGPASFGHLDSTGIWQPRAFALQTPNDGTTWSNSVYTSNSTYNGSTTSTTFAGSDPATEGFLGSPDTSGTVEAGTNYGGGDLPAWIYFRPATPIKNVETLRVQTRYCQVIRINDNLVDVNQTAIYPTWTQIPSEAIPSDGEITCIAFRSTTGNARFTGIEVNGVVLLDGVTDTDTRNNPNDGRAWSGELSASGGFDGSYPVTYGFDGILNGANRVQTASTNTPIVWSTNITVNKLISIWNGQSTWKYQINDSGSYTTVTGHVERWKHIPFTGTLTNFKIMHATSGEDGAFSAIAIDGHVLVDKVADTSFKFDFDGPTTKNTIDPDVTTGYDGPNPSILQGDGTVSTDPNSAYLMAAFAGNGGNYGDPFLKDWSPNASDFTKVGSVESDNTNLHFYDRVGRFSSGDAVLRSATDSDFGPGTGKFTWEVWFMLKKSLYTHGNDVYIVDMRDGTTNGHAGYASVSYLNSGAGPTNSLILGGSGSSNQGSHAAINENQWYHLACVREGTGSGELKFYLDGTLYTSQTEAKDSDLEWFVVGNVNSYASYDYGFPGYIEDFRYYKGIAKYTSDFQVPARNDWIPTKVASSTAKSELILFNNSVSNLTSDKSGKVTVTNVGSLSTTSAPTNSHGITTVANFTGTQRLTTNFQSIVGGGAPSTIDVWWDHGAAQNNTQPSGSAMIMAENTSDSFIEINGSGSASTTVYLYGSTAVDLGAYEWGHCRVTWDGTNSTLYWNGVQKYQGTASNATGAFTIGAGSSGNAPFNGKIGPVIITRGDLGPPPLGGLVLDSGEFTVNDDKTIVIPSETCLSDSPSNSGIDTGKGGEINGNYCTLNPLTQANNSGTQTFGKGNLYHESTSSAGAWHMFRGNMAIPKGSTDKFYYEVEWVQDTGNTDFQVGWVDPFQKEVTASGFGDSPHEYCFRGDNGKKFNNNTQTNYGSAPSQGDIVGVGYDNGSIRFWVNGTEQDSGTAAWTGVSKDLMPGFATYTQSNDTFKANFNFGQRPFKHAQSGYKTLCTQNLDDTFSGDQLNDPSKYFDVLTYTGTGTTSQDVLGLGFQPDLVWIKNRGAVGTHNVFDAVRGNTKRLFPDLDQAQNTNANIFDFKATGIEVTEDSGVTADTNDEDATFVAWNWDAGTAASGANNDGTVNVSAGNQWVNATAGFSITAYTGDNASGGCTVGHGLSAKPKLVIVKRLDAGQNWIVWVEGLTSDQNLHLHTNEAENTPAGGYIDDALTTNDVVKLVGDPGGNGNMNGTADYIMYCWTPIQGYSSFGTFTGNGSADGPFVYTGFQPRWIMTKNAKTTRQWVIWDTKRSPLNFADECLFPDVNNAEATKGPDSGTDNDIDILSNGFKIRNVDSAQNESTKKIIYAAFAEHPFKTARAV